MVSGERVECTRCKNHYSTETERQCLSPSLRRADGMRLLTTSINYILTAGGGVTLISRKRVHEMVKVKHSAPESCFHLWSTSPFLRKPKSFVIRFSWNCFKFHYLSGFPSSIYLRYRTFIQRVNAVILE